MNEHDQRVISFLKSSWRDDKDLIKARSRLESEQEKLEACPSPKYQQLAHSRILASTSLSRRLNERREWDEANLWVAKAIEDEVAIDLSSLQKLNGMIHASEGKLREVAVFADGEEYLSVEAFPEALVILQSYLAETDPVARAALVYIFVINVHPFINGNGRTARLAADWILMKEGYPPLCFVTASQGHVAEDQAGRHRTLPQCILKCYLGLMNSYSILMS